jgi:hypothetical protein
MVPLTSPLNSPLASPRNHRNHRNSTPPLIPIQVSGLSFVDMILIGMATLSLLVGAGFCIDNNFVLGLPILSIFLLCSLTLILKYVCQTKQAKHEIKLDLL